MSENDLGFVTGSPAPQLVPVVPFTNPVPAGMELRPCGYFRGNYCAGGYGMQSGHTCSCNRKAECAQLERAGHRCPAPYCVQWCPVQGEVTLLCNLSSNIYLSRSCRNAGKRGVCASLPAPSRPVGHSSPKWSGAHEVQIVYVRRKINKYTK